MKRNSFSHCATVADFNIAGWIDVFVPQFNHIYIDFVLLNLGTSSNLHHDSDERWFTAVLSSALGMIRYGPAGAAGDQVVAMDYDRDEHENVVASRTETSYLRRAFKLEDICPLRRLKSTGAFISWSAKDGRRPSTSLFATGRREVCDGRAIIFGAATQPVRTSTPN